MPAEVDTSQLERFVRELGAGLRGAGDRAARHQADETASRVRQLVPVRTGRLASTVGAVGDGEGFAVTYGGDLPYARYIARRSGCVEDGIAGADTTFEAACQAAALSEVRRA